MLDWVTGDRLGQSAIPTVFVAVREHDYIS
jgi:hypothetical protein